MPRRNRALLVAGFACAAALAGTRAARAQVPSPGDTMADDATEKERTALYREGVAAAEAGRWVEALDRFQRVVALRTAPRALLALAAAEEHVGRLVGAKRTYGVARDDARAQNDEATAAKAEASLATLEPRIPKVALTLPAGVTGAEARLDGAPIEISGGGVDLDPGVYRLVVTAPGKRPFEERVAVAAGQRREIAIVFPVARDVPAVPLVAGGERPENAPVAEPVRMGRPPLATWILGGVGLAAAATGLIVRLQAQSVYDDAKLAEQIDRGNDARERIIAGTVIAGAGLALVGVGGVWWAIAPGPTPTQTAFVIGRSF
jgi:hypothetical protein